MTSELRAEPSQILGFVAGAAVVAVLDPHRTLGIDGLTAATMLAVSWTHLRGRLIQATERAGEP